MFVHHFFIYTQLSFCKGFGATLEKSDGASGKEPACQCRRHKRSWFHPWVWKLIPSLGLEEGMATHSSILAWRISQTEEPNRVSKSQTGLKQLNRHSGKAHYISVKLKDKGTGAKHR